MGYAAYLQGLLQPLGIYDLSLSSYSGAELEALGQCFDALQAIMEESLRESLPVTAQAEGLTYYEQLLALPVSLAKENTGSLICTLLRQGSKGTNAQSLTLALDAALSDSALSPQVSDGDKPGVVKVTFPTLEGRPQNFEPTLQVIERTLPCHLAPFYQYLNDYEDMSI